MSGSSWLRAQPAEVVGGDVFVEEEVFGETVEVSGVFGQDLLGLSVGVLNEGADLALDESGDRIVDENGDYVMTPPQESDIYNYKEYVGWKAVLKRLDEIKF